jgi:hypothetical protein
MKDIRNNVQVLRPSGFECHITIFWVATAHILVYEPHVSEQRVVSVLNIATKLRV